MCSKRLLLTMAVLGELVVMNGCGPLVVINPDDPTGGRPSAQPPSLSSPVISMTNVASDGAITLSSSVSVRSRSTVTSVEFKVTAPSGASFRVLAAPGRVGIYSAAYTLPRSYGGEFRVVAIATTSDGLTAQIDMPIFIQVPPGPPGSLL